MPDQPLVITICSSANFYRQAVELQAQLEKSGFKVIIPKNAEVMKKTGDYDASHYKTWFNDSRDYHKKTDFMKTHFKEIERGDVCLVLNYEKHGIKNYIGGNVLIEMALALYLDKPIVILNEIPDESPYLEEILGMNPIVLHGKIESLSEVI
jgi:hypothetical protein